MNYAIIDENNIVINIAVANTPLNESWIFIDNRPVTFGDVYNGNDFYRNGEKVLTREEELTTVLNILLGEEE